MISRAKSQYTATEAAGELGVSLCELRTLIRAHILRPGENLSDLADAAFQPADLVILRFLSARQRALASRDSPC